MGVSEIHTKKGTPALSSFLCRPLPGCPIVHGRLPLGEGIRAPDVLRSPLLRARAHLPYKRLGNIRQVTAILSVKHLRSAVRRKFFNIHVENLCLTVALLLFPLASSLAIGGEISVID